MSVARVAGYPDFSSAGTSKFIPELWSGKLITKFYDATVFGEIANTDYEGEIKNQGDKVIIRTVPNITIKDYKKGQKLDNERPESAPVELLIDKAKYFGFELDDIDKVQTDLPLFEKWTTDASEQMKISVDTTVLGSIYADVAAANMGATAGRKSAAFNLGTTGSAVQITKANALDYIVDCGTVLDEQNVPETGRWMVIPAWMAGLIKKSDLKDASLTGDATSVLRNGRIGMIDRMTLYLSNNVATASDTGTKYYIMFGHKAGLTFASQLSKVRTIELTDTFGSAVQGLNVFGYKVIKPEALGVMYCYK